MSNRDTLAGDWKQLKGAFHSKWGKLTDDDIERAQGKFESLTGALQKRYGLAKEKAEAAVDAFIKSINEAKS